MSDPKVLFAPCRWCGYSGENYWQAGTHGHDCPWRTVGGMREREMLLLDVQPPPLPSAERPQPAEELPAVDCWHHPEHCACFQNVPLGCATNVISSRICERGTQCCTVYHEAPRETPPPFTPQEAAEAAACVEYYDLTLPNGQDLVGMLRELARLLAERREGQG